jgi:hypothetical protein
VWSGVLLGIGVVATFFCFLLSTAKSPAKTECIIFWTRKIELATRAGTWRKFFLLFCESKQKAEEAVVVVFEMGQGQSKKGLVEFLEFG